jgi:alkylhydroperoxidase/carboxymuconolactone decarboxylase family protein YurZ
MKPQKAIGTLPAKLHQLVQTEVRERYPDKRRAKNSAVLEIWMKATALMNETRQMYAIATTAWSKDEGAR